MSESLGHYAFAPWLRQGVGRAIASQDGDATALEKLPEVHKAPIIKPFNAQKRGAVRQMDAELIGRASVLLGGGRQKASDSIDFAVGFSGIKKIGEMQYMLVLAVWPGLLDMTARALSIKSGPNLLLFVAALVLIVVCVHLSWEVSRLEDRSRALAEEVGLLRLEIDRRPPPTPLDRAAHRP